MGREARQEVGRRIRNSPVPFVALLLGVLGLTCWMALPLLRPLAWSAVFSYFAYPAYRFLHQRAFGGRWANLAAALTTGIILLFLAIPLGTVAVSLGREAVRLYGVLSEWLPLLDREGVDALLSRIHASGASVLGPLFFRVPELKALLGETGRWVGSGLTALSRGMVANAFHSFFSLVVITISSFFLVRDGRAMAAFVGDLLPLPFHEKKALFLRTQRMLQAVVYGIMFTAAIQATLGGIGWWFVGLPHPVFFGGVMFVTGMIPFVGTPVVWAPGGIVLLMTGHTQEGVLLLLWGGGVVSTVDNFLRPLFISEGSKAHVLLVFVGVLGGLAAWGFLGLFLGPMLLSLSLFLLESYRTILREGERRASSGDGGGT